MFITFSVIFRSLTFWLFSDFLSIFSSLNLDPNQLRARIHRFISKSVSRKKDFTVTWDKYLSFLTSQDGDYFFRTEENLRSSGGDGGWMRKEKTGERISRWGRREKRPPPMQDTKMWGETISEFKALDINFWTITPYCIKTLHVTILIDISSFADINTDVMPDKPLSRHTKIQSYSREMWCVSIFFLGCFLSKRLESVNGHPVL